MILKLAVVLKVDAGSGIALESSSVFAVIRLTITITAIVMRLVYSI